MHLTDQIHNLPTTARDLTYLFLGKPIGYGLSRTVYELAQDKTCVVKYEHDGNRFQNILEWEIWETVKSTKLAKWFAPCVDISPNGRLLIQKRAEIIPRSQYPKEIPSFFTDLKYQNYGIIGKQFVCLDYGTAHIPAINKTLSAKLKKAEWWED